MAGCAAFPTRAEGFGLPMIEALLRGMPVACSDLPVLREVGDELPLFFDPDDPERTPLAPSSRGSPRRGRCPGAHEWAARFTWQAAAEGTWDVYERVLAA